MESLVALARGPVFIFAFTFMVLGLLRHVGLTLWETIRAVRSAGDRKIPYARIVRATVNWLVPVGKLKERIVLSLTSFLFHVGVLIVPIFLGGHIALWARGLGISWPAIPNVVADVLSILVIVTAVGLVIERLASPATRALSRFQDCVLPVIVALPFVSGVCVMHPFLNPFSYEAMLLVHVMSANILFVLVPLTKLSHMALIPSVHLVSEVAWHWPPDAGSKVAATLGKESEPI